jgi:glyoxylase-like metal-dependent hydrolase (beta-lactamase superfamily II)
MCPRAPRLLAPARLVAHCLLIETGQGLVLVDTGFGTGDVADPGRLGGPFRVVARPKCLDAETAIRQIERRGLDPGEVRHILLTHLDLDHAGGLGDFPNAEVHVFAPELAAARKPSMRERSRYLSAQWAHRANWVEHEVDGDSWLGFDSVRLLPDLDVEIAMVPLVGHTRGHSGIAVNGDDGWLLHCGDAYFHRDEVATPPSCPPGLRMFQRLNGVDGEARDHNQQRLRELARARRGEVSLICSHDAELLDAALAG